MTSVSVVIPTRDRATFLETTLRSVLWQRDVELEVIVVDDGSTDTTPNVVARAQDPRVTLMRRDAPGGPSVARNAGADRATGEWLAFVDDDDVWAPNKLMHQVRAAEAAGRDWAYVGTVSIGESLTIVSGRPPPTPEDVLAALPRFNPIPGGGSNVALRRRTLTEVGGFDDRSPPCEDWELWARLARRGLPASVPEPLMAYRLHAGGASVEVAAVERAARRIERLHGSAVDWGMLHRWLAESSLRGDRHVQALGQFARAAVRGQAVGVASDLIDIARRRVARTRGAGSRVGPSDDPWTAGAASWLRELERSRASESG